MIRDELWSEEEEEDGQDASEVYKLIRAAAHEEAEEQEERRRRIAVMLGAMFELVVKLVVSLLNSYKEQASRMAPLFLELQTLQCIVGAATTRIMSSMGGIGNAGGKRRRVEKEWWVKPRCLECDKFVAGRMDRESSRQLFNMSPDTFEWLCCQLAPLVHKTDTNFRSSIPPRKRIAIGIHRLACGSSYLEVSKMFAVGEATVLTCTREVAAALSAAFGHVLAFPRGGAAVAKVIQGFECLTGTALPNCCGLVTVLHFKIKRPSGPSGSSFLDHTRSFSIAAQVVVDASTRILNLAVGFPGAMQDAKILKQSGLFDKVRHGMLLNGPAVAVKGGGAVSVSVPVPVPQYVIGSSIAHDYPLLPWLMLPYSEEEEEEEKWKAHFNQRLKRLELLGDSVFLSLRKWGVLDKTMNVDVQTAVELVVACAILHNILLDKDKNKSSSSSSSSSSQKEEDEEPGQEEQDVEQVDLRRQDGGDGDDAAEIRDALAWRCYCSSSSSSSLN